MKKITLFGALLLVVGSVGAQLPAPNEQDQVTALIKAVQVQQAQIAANQEKIDARLATLAETIRLAKIYASRGGR
jgi:hypothetical protein